MCKLLVENTNSGEENTNSGEGVLMKFMAKLRKTFKSFWQNEQLQNLNP